MHFISALSEHENRLRSANKSTAAPSPQCVKPQSQAAEQPLNFLRSAVCKKVPFEFQNPAGVIILVLATHAERWLKSR